MTTNQHRLNYSQDNGTRISERHLGGRNRGNHFMMGWRVNCSCGFTEKAGYEYEIIARGQRHQQNPKGWGG